MWRPFPQELRVFGLGDVSDGRLECFFNLSLESLQLQQQAVTKQRRTSYQQGIVLSSCLI